VRISFKGKSEKERLRLLKEIERQK